MKLDFYNESGYKVWQYEKIINKVFKNINSKKKFNVIFVNKEEIQRINKEYRNIDKVTDVISFALIDDKELVQTNELGDIFICVERAKEQAVEYGHSEAREFAFLAVHGYLHLCGHDHQTKEEEKIMFDIQEKILEKANLKR
ncbi:MAG: rRNA maturation RNase YbeY [Acholeplasmatales bacterium]|nr:rRNA maturation RNase YbeY [Acholeplasmatales bacterium]